MSNVDHFWSFIFSSNGTRDESLSIFTIRLVFVLNSLVSSLSNMMHVDRVLPHLQLVVRIFLFGRRGTLICTFLNRNIRKWSVHANGVVSIRSGHIIHHDEIGTFS